MFNKNHQYAMWIVELFEDLLDEHQIYIPDEDREGDECEACLYGTTYGNLVDKVEVLINELTGGDTA